VPKELSMLTCVYYQLAAVLNTRDRCSTLTAVYGQCHDDRCMRLEEKDNGVHLCFKRTRDPRNFISNWFSLETTSGC